MLVNGWEQNERVRSHSAIVDLQAGQARTRSSSSTSKTFAMPKFAWAGAGRARSRRSKKHWTRHAQADAVVFVGGLTGDVEGEEMKVSYPGFAGGDRTDLRLPGSQRKLLEALHGTGKPIALVLTGGSALAVDWAQERLPAILMAWYPGQRGGTAVADVLFGTAIPRAACR